MIEMRWNKVKVFSSAATVAFAAVFASPSAVMAQQAPAGCAVDEGPSQTLDTNVARVLGTVYEQMTADQFQEALAGLNQLIAQRGESMKPFDRATTYELRGSVKANLEDFRGALSDFQTALNANALPAARNNQLRYFIAQLQFQEGQYQQAIAGLNQWISNAQRCNQAVDPNAYYLLAAAYTQIEPPNWRAAVGPAENAVRAHEAQQTDPRKSYYDLLNLVYSELNDNAKRAPLLEKMVNLWPGTKSYWTQLSGAYSVMNRDRDAFAVLEVAYRAGLLTTESEMLTLIQYYSFFDNPYRGADLLEREMAAGNIKRNQDNLVLLSQLWSQAREHKKSIPILREAARNASNGELYYRLGMVLLADEQYSQAQQALESAINRGGLGRDDTGDAWLLLGTARFSQAGPEDTAIWASARQAFVNAQRYDKARSRATDWIRYIDAVIDTYWQGLTLTYNQNVEACNDDIGRIEREQRIRDLQNRQPNAQEVAEEEARLAECQALFDQGPPKRGSAPRPTSNPAPADEPAEPGDDEAAENEDGGDQ